MRRSYTFEALLVLAACGGVTSTDDGGAGDAGDAGACETPTWDQAPTVLATNLVLRDVAGYANAGRAVALWSDEHNALLVTRRAADGTWSAAEFVSLSSAAKIVDARIATAVDGSAIVVWERADDPNGWSHLRASRYTTQSGWSPETVLDSPHDGTPVNVIASDARVVMRPDGSAFVVWIEGDAYGGEAAPPFVYVNARRFDPAAGWGDGIAIAHPGWNAFNPSVAVDALGNAIAVWSTDSTKGYSVLFELIQSARYDASTASWSAPSFIDACSNSMCGLPEQTSAPQIASNANGEAIAVWSERDTGANVRPWAAHFSNGTWSPAKLLDANETASAVRETVAIDASGNAIAAWQLAFGRIFANRFSGGAWHGAVELDTPGTTSEAPAIAFDDDGNALVVWDDTRAVWGTRMDAKLATFAPATQISVAYDYVFAGQRLSITRGTCPSALLVWTSNAGTEALLYH